MTNDPIDLDLRRGMNAQVATEVRREHLLRFQAEQVALARRQSQLEQLLLAEPAEAWPAAAAKAQYLIQLYALTAEAQEPQRKRLIAATLDDLARLAERDEAGHAQAPEGPEPAPEPDPLP